jgi:hypothetical protein
VRGERSGWLGSGVRRTKFATGRSKRMSERERRGERTRREAEERERIGPDIDADGRRMDEPRANDGPRRVGAEREAREERGQQGAHRRGDDDREAENDRGTS